MSVSTAKCAASMMTEARELVELGYPVQAAATGRTALEVAIADRLGPKFEDRIRCAIKDRVKLLRRETSLNCKKGDRIRNLFFVLSGYTHGRRSDRATVPKLLDVVDELIGLIEES